MSDSLRDQLLGLGFKPSSGPVSKPIPSKLCKPSSPPSARSRPGISAASQPVVRSARHRVPSRLEQDDIDLAKAYALRARHEKHEQLEAERQKQEAARLRREAQAKLAALLDGQALNSVEADIARHFEYGGKIKRVYVTAEQLKALNAGELGVVQQGGRYLLVTAKCLAEAEAIFAPAIALKIDPVTASMQQACSANTHDQVPDDLIW